MVDRFERIEIRKNQIAQAYRTIQPLKDFVLYKSLVEAHLNSLSLARGCSSVGRAVALQAIGQEFDSPQLHHLVRSYS